MTGECRAVTKFVSGRCAECLQPAEPAHIVDQGQGARIEIVLACYLHCPKHQPTAAKEWPAEPPKTTGGIQGGLF